jgi:hypothetical protein
MRPARTPLDHIGFSSPDDRGQTEPLAALAAVFAVVVGLTTYALVVADAGAPSDRDRAGPTLAAVHDAVATQGVVRHGRLDRALDAGPAASRLNVSLVTDWGRWTVGPPAAAGGDAASRRVSVRRGPGRTTAGRLRVVVWR